MCVFACVPRCVYVNRKGDSVCMCAQICVFGKEEAVYVCVSMCVLGR